MPLRQDGSGGTRSARPPTSNPLERTSHDTEFEGVAGRDVHLLPESYYFPPESSPRSEFAAIGVLVAVTRA
jgi:hypothetical protein